MSARWVSDKIMNFIDVVYQSLFDEDIQWKHRVDNLHDEVLLSLEHCQHMERCFHDMKWMMQNTKDASISCSIAEQHRDKSTQMLIDELIGELILLWQDRWITCLVAQLERWHLHLNYEDWNLFSGTMSESRQKRGHLMEESFSFLSSKMKTFESLFID